jgi:hypothetical protein
MLNERFPNRKIYCSVNSRCWVAISKETTKTFAARQQIFNKCTQPLLGYVFADRHVLTEMIGATMGELCFLYGPCRVVISDTSGGGVEYLHRDPASRRRRRKGKSQIWDSKIWSRVPRDFDSRKTALARASSIYKRQPRPLVKEGVPQKQDRNCQTAISNWSWAPDGARHQDLLTDWPSVAMWLWLWQLSQLKIKLWRED